MHVFVIRARLLLLGIGALAGWSNVAAAAGTVGTGTPTSCTEGALDTALFGGGLLTFDCGGAVTIATTTTKTISTDTTIDGGGLITLDGSTLNDFVMLVPAGVTLTLRSLTITDATTTSFLPEIGANGTVIATDCTFSGNSLGFGIQGVGAGSVLTATNCTFSNNLSALWVEGGAITATDCTFVGNGTGITALALHSIPPPPTFASVTITNCTFSANGSGMAIPGISNGTLTNCTITGSTVTGIGPTTAGVAPLVVTNTIIADNPGGNCGVGVIDNGHNLDDGTSCGFTAAGSLSNTPAGLDPAGLQNNGGPTETIALLASSAAVDGGDDGVCSLPPVDGLDQRGVTRPGAGHTHCSIGAYEFVFAPTPTATPTNTLTPTATPTLTPTNTPSPTPTPTPTAVPAQAIQNLMNAVDALPLPPGIANALTSTFGAAVRKIGSGNSVAACNQLSAFINKVAAQQQAGRLSAAQAEDLTSAANAIRAQLGCER